jgi:DNA-binding NtrC family response regulator
VDIPLLVKFLLQRFAKKFGRPMKHVSEATLQRLSAYPWPGNIRELQNVLERAILLSRGDTLNLAPDFAPLTLAGMPASSAPPPPPAPGPNPVPVPAPAAPTAQPPASAYPGILSAPGVNAPLAGGALEDVERRHIESVLAQTNWMIEGERGAARILNLNPSTLRSRMQKLGIKRPGR